ncbi:unnamed protein product, partial [marine sediment metagenome]
AAPDIAKRDKKLLQKPHLSDAPGEVSPESSPTPRTE